MKDCNEKPFMSFSQIHLMASGISVNPFIQCRDPSGSTITAKKKLAGPVLMPVLNVPTGNVELLRVFQKDLGFRAH